MERGDRSRDKISSHRRDQPDNTEPRCFANSGMGPSPCSGNRRGTITTTYPVGTGYEILPYGGAYVVTCRARAAFPTTAWERTSFWHSCRTAREEAAAPHMVGVRSFPTADNTVVTVFRIVRAPGGREARRNGSSARCDQQTKVQTSKAANSSKLRSESMEMSGTILQVKQPDSNGQKAAWRKGLDRSLDPADHRRPAAGCVRRTHSRSPPVSDVGSETSASRVRDAHGVAARRVGFSTVPHRRSRQRHDASVSNGKSHGAPAPSPERSVATSEATGPFVRHPARTRTSF